MYVLDPILQDRGKLPKWRKHSRCGVYLGHSPAHANSVGHILNLATGAITPQYHVIYDELFHTVFRALTDKIFNKDLWEKLLTLESEDNHLTALDCTDPDVVSNAADLFNQFIDTDDEDDADDDNDSGTKVMVDSVPEGDGHSFFA